MAPDPPVHQFNGFTTYLRRAEGARHTTPAWGEPPGPRSSMLASENQRFGAWIADGSGIPQSLDPLGAAQAADWKVRTSDHPAIFP